MNAGAELTFRRWLLVAALALATVVSVHVAVPIVWDYSKFHQFPPTTNPLMLRFGEVLAWSVVGFVLSAMVPIRLSDCPDVTARRGSRAAVPPSRR